MDREETKARDNEQNEEKKGKAKSRHLRQAREAVQPSDSYLRYWEGTHHDEGHAQSGRVGAESDPPPRPLFHPPSPLPPRSPPLPPASSSPTHPGCNGVHGSCRGCSRGVSLFWSALLRSIVFPHVSLDSTLDPSKPSAGLRCRLAPPFGLDRRAVSFWGHIIRNLSGFPPKRDCSTRGVNAERLEASLEAPHSTPFLPTRVYPFPPNDLLK